MVNGRGLYQLFVNGMFVKKSPMFYREHEDVLFFESFEGYKLSLYQCVSLGVEFNNTAIGRCGFQPTYVLYGGFHRGDERLFTCLTSIAKRYTAFAGINPFDGLMEHKGNDTQCYGDREIELASFRFGNNKCMITKRLWFKSYKSDYLYYPQIFIRTDFGEKQSALDVIKEIRYQSLIFEFIGNRSLHPNELSLGGPESPCGVLPFDRKHRYSSAFCVRAFLQNHEKTMLQQVMAGLFCRREELWTPLVLHGLSKQKVEDSLEESLLYSVRAFEIIARLVGVNSIVDPAVFDNQIELAKDAIGKLEIEDNLKEKIIISLGYANEPNLKARYTSLLCLPQYAPFMDRHGSKMIKDIVDNRNYLTHFSRVPKNKITQEMVVFNMVLVDAVIVNLAQFVDVTFMAERYGYHYSKNRSGS